MKRLFDFGFTGFNESLHKIADNIEKARVSNENKGFDETRIVAIEAKLAELWSFFLEPNPKRPEETQVTKKGKKFREWLLNRN